jgi:hypothetical protein
LCVINETENIQCDRGRRKSQCPGHSARYGTPHPALPGVQSNRRWISRARPRRDSVLQSAPVLSATLIAPLEYLEIKFQQT